MRLLVVQTHVVLEATDCVPSLLVVSVAVNPPPGPQAAVDGRLVMDGADALPWAIVKSGVRPGRRTAEVCTGRRVGGQCALVRR